MTPAPGVLALVGLYDTAARRLRVLLRRAVAEKTRQHRRVQLALCRTILRQLRHDTPALAQIAVLDTLQTAVSLVDRLVGAKGSLSRIQRAAARIAAENMAEPLLAATVRVGRNVEDAFRTTGLVHATAHAITEASTEKAAEGLREDLERQGLTGFVDKAGRRWQLQVYSAMVVKTTASELQQRAVADRMIAHGFDLIRVPGHEHARDECSPYENRVWSLTGNAKGYRKLPRLPPWHPACSHLVLPAREAVAERAARLNA
jgi:hypothetical protein